MVGGLIMTHSDDDGLVTPPKLAPMQLVIVPIFKTDAEKLTVMEAADSVFRELKAAGIRVKLDDRDSLSPGAKFFDWELKGIPLRMELGPKDVQNNSVVVVPRILLDSEEAPKPGRKQKLFISRTELHSRIPQLLEKLQTQLYRKCTRPPRSQQHSQCHRLRRDEKACRTRCRIYLCRMVRLGRMRDEGERRNEGNDPRHPVSGIPKRLCAIALPRLRELGEARSGVGEGVLTFARLTFATDSLTILLLIVTPPIVART